MIHLTVVYSKKTENEENIKHVHTLHTYKYMPLHSSEEWKCLYD